jgi:hypothetical protein
MKKLFLISMIVSICFTNVNAHGIHVDYSFQYPNAKVHVYYSKTSPVANAEISVFAPGSDEIFVSGKTDKEGNYEFTPDVPGNWTVKVDDGMGHRKTAVISIEDFSSEIEPEEGETIEEHHTHEHQGNHHHDHCHIPLVYKIIFGLALIFGFTGFWYGLKARKR